MTKQAKFNLKFARRPAEFDRLAKVWANRREMLLSLLNKEVVDVTIEARILQAVDRYDRAAFAAKQRSVFYVTPKRRARTKLLLAAVGRGEFRGRDPWAFPIEGAVKDAASIFLGP